MANLLCNSSRIDNSVNAAKLGNCLRRKLECKNRQDYRQTYLVNSNLNRALIANIDLFENNRNAVLFSQHLYSFIAVLLENIKDDEGFKVNITESICHVEPESTSSTVES